MQGCVKEGRRWRRRQRRWLSGLSQAKQRCARDDRKERSERSRLYSDFLVHYNQYKLRRSPRWFVVDRRKRECVCVTKDAHLAADEDPQDFIMPSALLLLSPYCYYYYY
ncbi:hypothetical protein VTO42DRAFT_5161 [Malbranchea cinnamomea]